MTLGEQFSQELQKKASTKGTPAQQDYNDFMRGVTNAYGDYGSYYSAGYDTNTKSLLDLSDRRSGEWDYQTSETGMNGESLPFGAESWDAFGRPYYGEGIEGWWKGVTSRVTSPTQLVANFIDDPGDETALEWGSRLLENVSQIGNLSDTTGLDSPLTYALRVSKEVIGGAMTVLQLPAIGVERTIGLAHVGLTGEARTLDEAWQASRIAYSNIANTALVNEFINRYRHGENPELLAQELQNPWMELGGQLVLDPLNLIGWIGKGGKLADRGADIARGLRGWEMSEDMMQVFDKAGDINDAMIATNKIEELSNVFGASVDAAKATKLKQEYGVGAIVATGRQAEFQNRVQDGISNVVAALKNSKVENSGVIDTLVDIARAGSDNPDVRLLGMNGLVNTPIPQMMLSSRGMELSAFLNKVVGEGDEAKKFIDMVQGLQDDLPAMVAFFGNKADDVSRTLFPTIQDMVAATDKVTEAAKLGKTVTKRTQDVADMLVEVERNSPFAMHVANLDAKLGKVFRPLNSFFGKVYMGSSPGYAMRNMMNNTFTLLVDMGPKALIVDGKPVITTGWEAVRASTNKMLGFTELGTGLAAGARAIGKEADIAGGALGQKLFDIIPNLASKNERFTGALYINKSVRDTMKRGLPHALTPLREALETAGAQGDTVSIVMQHAIDNFGDIDKATDMLREISTGGKMSAGRDITMLSYDTRRYFEEAGQYDELLDIFFDASLTRKEDVIGAIEKLRTKHLKVAGNVTSDAIAAGRDMPDVATMGRVTSEGFLSEDIGNAYTAMVQSHANTRNAYGNIVERMRHFSDPNAEFIPLNLDYNGAEISKSISDRWQGKFFGMPSDTPAYEWRAIADGLGADIPHEASIRDIKSVIVDALHNKAREDWTKYNDDIYNATEAWFGENINKLVTQQDAMRQAFDKAKDARTYSGRMSEAAYDGKNLVRSAVDTKLEGADRAREIANKFGVATATKTGTPSDKHLLNILNKYSDEAFKSLDDVTDEQVLEAFIRRASEKEVTQADISALAKKKVSDVLEVAEEGEELSMMEKIKLAQEARFGEARATTGTAAATEKVITADNVRAAWMDEAKEIAEDIRLGEEVLTPPMTDSLPSYARAASESSDGFSSAVDKIIAQVDERWDNSINVFSPEIEKVLADAPTLVSDRVGQLQSMAGEVATHARDFGLLDYTQKKYGDLALAYLYPYSFWYSGTYKNWLSRVASDPKVLARYARYRGHLEKIHAGAPEWYKYQVSVNDLPGVDVEHPLFFNLEATLWPLNGITGVDFNDPHKRVNGFTALLDDLGKFGPSTWTPYSIATAVGLAMNGEDEAASRWGGRLFPQTATIKAGLSMMNLNLPETPFTVGNELDPMVNIFSGGWDAYEKRRIGRALSQMADEGHRLEDGTLVTEEMAIDAAHTRSGEVWDSAAMLATRKRAPGQISSFFFGVGFKGRSEADMMTDTFYADYYSMMGQYDNLSPDEVRTSFDTLREKYPFMDTLLISKKDDLDRNRSYAYSVLGRIPPGQSGDIAKLAGIPEEMLSQFYEDKGRIDLWSEGDRNRFVTAVTDIGAVLAIPDTAVSQDWTRARNAYDILQDRSKEVFGDDIQDKVNLYYNMPMETQTQRADRDKWLRANGDVGFYLDFMAKNITTDPNLNAYYGGLQSVEGYLRRQMNSDIVSQLGEGVFDTVDQYYSILSGKERAAFKRQHPEIDTYYDIRDEWQERENEAMARVSNILRKAPEIQVRDDYTGETFGQEDVRFGLQAQPQVDWQQVIMPEAYSLVQEYWQGGGELDYYLEQYLDYIARDYGAGGAEDIIQQIGSSVVQ